MSADKIPTKVTLSKSRPLLNICVPINISASLFLNLFNISSRDPFFEVVSLSILRTLSSGKITFNSSSIFWVPTPKGLTYILLHSGHSFGISLS